MKAKRNRYDLSLWDVRKLQLYGRARESVQVATLNLASFGRRQTLVHHSAVAIPEHWALDRLNYEWLLLGLDNSTSTKTE
jgi:hypothetical protein